MNHSNTLKIFLPHYLGMFTVFRRVYSCRKANTLTNFITQECDFFLKKLRLDLNLNSLNKPKNGVFKKFPQGFTCTKFFCTNLHKFKGLDLLVFLLVEVFLAIFGYRGPAACNNEIRTLLTVANSFGHHFQGPWHTSKFGNKFFEK